MSSIITSMTDIFNKGGFDKASQYVLLVAFLIFVSFIIYYMKKTMEQRDKNDEKEDKRLQEEKEENSKITNKVLEIFEQNSNKQYEAMIKINESIISEVKNISICIKDGIDKMNNSLSEMIEKSNEKLISTIDEEKTMSLNEFQKQSKVLFEVGLRRINNSINERIEKNNLFKLKEGIIGTQECCYLDGELASVSKKHLLEIKEDIKLLQYHNEAIKTKVLFEYDRIINSMNISLCELFDVNDGYSKDSLYRSVRSLIEKTLNLANSLNYEYL